MISRELVYERCPRLRESEHQITSHPTDDYNCVAWVARDVSRWWHPDFCWPPDVPKPDGDDDLACFIELFVRWGYAVCGGPDLEPNYVKIALYASAGTFHHVAKQLPSGSWSSKLGEAHDLKHTLEALEGTIFFPGAVPSVFMGRPLLDGEDFTLEETGLVRM